MAHRSTIIFVNARRLAERLATRLNELAAERAGLALDDGSAAPEVVKAHHGSLSRERRLLIEDELKTGRLRGLVATSSLELGIDMVRSIVIRSSRRAHYRGLPAVRRRASVGRSQGKVFPTSRCLVEAAVVVDRVRQRSGRARSPQPLDVLAQQISSCVPCRLAGRRAAGRGAAIRQLRPLRRAVRIVLDMLSVAIRPKSSAASPRIVWDRVNDTIRRVGARSDHQWRAIPDAACSPWFCPMACASAARRKIVYGRAPVSVPARRDYVEDRRDHLR
jgi:ATP-dependent Lhr-like helicase